MDFVEQVGLVSQRGLRPGQTFEKICFVVMVVKMPGNHLLLGDLMVHQRGWQFVAAVAARTGCQPQRTTRKGLGHRLMCLMMVRLLEPQKGLASVLEQKGGRNLQQHQAVRGHRTLE
jgi:hypothetical protein